MSSRGERLAALREELKNRELGGFVIPHSDEHLSEYVGAYAKRLAWLTGFDGSVGTAVVLSDTAALFVDGRYTLQARQQVDGRHWSYQTVPQTSPEAWLRDQAPAGARIGYDPWVHSRAWVNRVGLSVKKKDLSLVPVGSNPVDAVWTDRPGPSEAKIFAHPEELAGRSSTDKRIQLARGLTGVGADAVVLSALDSIAWTFNIRGDDIVHTPVALAYAVVHRDGSSDLFVAPRKLDDPIRAHLGPSVRLHPRDAIESYLRGLHGGKVLIDPQSSVDALFLLLEEGGATIIEGDDPIVLPKAIKNSAEIGGHRAAQARDGAALSRFLHWIDVEGPRGGVSELAATEELLRCRQTSGQLRDLSFDTISGAGPNGAIVHYRATSDTNRTLELNSLYLVDSGAQYVDGTTDVTRTISIGTPTAEMRDRYTRVLKGHIALARAVFPPGTSGRQLDLLARQSLWEAGLDYAHGTGHGVGSYLSVHEGPQRIGYTGACDAPLAAGMILSNEPGYYKAGEYGIRIENLVLVVPREIPGAERSMLGFETLTFAPFDRHLIDTSLLTVTERAWVDAYHADVANIIAPQLEGLAQEWLLETTRPLS
jgi:Xaa-Pro aminopeptidase